MGACRRVHEQFQKTAYDRVNLVATDDEGLKLFLVVKKELRIRKEIYLFVTPKQRGDQQEAQFCQ